MRNPPKTSPLSTSVRSDPFLFGVMIVAVLIICGLLVWRVFQGDADIVVAEKGSEGSFTEIVHKTTSASLSTNEVTGVAEEIGIGDQAIKDLKVFGRYAEPWMKTVEIVKIPDIETRAVTMYLVIQGDASSGEGGSRTIVDKKGELDTERSSNIFDEEFGICSGATVEKKGSYFVLHITHSPCEAFVETEDRWYRMGEKKFTVVWNSDASSLSFTRSTDEVSTDVRLVFDGSCEADIGDLAAYDSELNVIKKTFITGVTVKNVFYPMSNPLAVTCGEYYGERIGDPKIGQYYFYETGIGFALTQETPHAKAQIRFGDPMKVDFYMN